MTAKRIVHVSPAHPANDPRIVYKQVPALAKHYRVYCLLPEVVEQRTDAITYISLPRHQRLFWRLLFVHPRIVWHVFRIRPTIVHIYMPELLPIAFLFKLLGIHIIYEVQEDLRRKFGRKQFNNHPIFQTAFDVFDNLARQHFYHIFTENSYLEEYTNLRLPYVVVHNFPALEQFALYRRRQAPVPTNAPEFLYMGIISFDRALDTLVRAVYQLKNAYPALRIHLFGRCSFDMEGLKRLPEYDAVKENLMFYGQTDQQQVLPYANRCVAGLALLKQVGDYPHSYPTKLFEYMALGLPVLTSDFFLYRTVVDLHRCGLCTNAENAHEVANLMQWLIEHPTENYLMGINGLQACKGYYNWETEVKELIRLYNCIVQSKDNFKFF